MIAPLTGRDKEREELERREERALRALRHCEDRLEANQHALWWRSATDEDLRALEAALSTARFVDPQDPWITSEEYTRERVHGNRKRINELFSSVRYEIAAREDDALFELEDEDER